MKNPLVARGIGLFAASVMAFTLSGQDARADIKIGYSGALTGPVAFLGLDIRRGAEMAIESVNAKGGVKGQKFVLVTRDDEHNPVKTVANHRELVEREQVVAILGTTNSASMLATAPIINDQLKVPVLCPATDATAITENDAWKNKRDNYIFRIGMYGRGQSNFLVDSMVKKFGYKKVGLLTWTAGWGVTGRGELNRRLKELGMTPVADETYDTADTDLTPQILKLKKAGSEVVINYGLVRENAFVTRTKQKLADTTPYASAWGIAAPAFWKAAGESAEGVLTSTTVVIDGPQPPERVAVLKKYAEKYKQEMDAPFGFFAAYDIIHLLAEVMNKVGTKPADIRAGLENVPEFKGLIAHFKRPVFTRDRHDALTEDDMILGRWTNGKLLQVHYDAGKGPYVVLDSNEKKYIDTKTLTLK
jgi:branched-chain amino acid transport system substrate-binding protein